MKKKINITGWILVLLLGTHTLIAQTGGNYVYFTVSDAGNAAMCRQNGLWNVEVTDNTQAYSLQITPAAGVNLCGAQLGTGALTLTQITNNTVTIPAGISGPVTIFYSLDCTFPADYRISTDFVLTPESNEGNILQQETLESPVDYPAFTTISNTTEYLYQYKTVNNSVPFTLSATGGKSIPHQFHVKLDFRETLNSSGLSGELSLIELDNCEFVIKNERLTGSTYTAQPDIIYPFILNSNDRKLINHDFSIDLTTLSGYQPTDRITEVLVKTGVTAIKCFDLDPQEKVEVDYTLDWSNSCTACTGINACIQADKKEKYTNAVTYLPQFISVSPQITTSILNPDDICAVNQVGVLQVNISTPANAEKIALGTISHSISGMTITDYSINNGVSWIPYSSTTLDLSTLTFLPTSPVRDENGLKILPPGNTLSIRFRFNVTSNTTQCSIYNISYKPTFTYSPPCNQASSVSGAMLLYSETKNSESELTGPTDVQKNNTYTITYRPDIDVSGSSGFMTICSNKTYKIQLIAPAYVSFSNPTINGVANSATISNKIITAASGFTLLPSGNTIAVTISVDNGCSGDGFDNITWKLIESCTGANCERCMDQTDFEYYRHCEQGGNGNNSCSFGTTKLTAERTTFGYAVPLSGIVTDINTLTPLTRSTTTAINREAIYPGDTLELFAEGNYSFAQNCGEQLQLNQLLVRITYVPKGNDEFLELISGGAFIWVGNTRYNAVLRAGSPQAVLNGTRTEVQMDFIISGTVSGNVPAGAVNLLAKLRTKSSVCNDAAFAGKLRIERLRAYHGHLPPPVSSSTPQFTDTWGDNMLLLSPVIAIKPNVAVTQNCNLNKQVNLELRAAEHGDDFPNEFRPVGALGDVITYTLPPNTSYIAGTSVMQLTGGTTTLSFAVGEPTLTTTAAGVQELSWNKHFPVLEKFAETVNLKLTFGVKPTDECIHQTGDFAYSVTVNKDLKNGCSSSGTATTYTEPNLRQLPQLQLVNATPITVTQSAITHTIKLRNFGGTVNDFWVAIEDNNNTFAITSAGTTYTTQSYGTTGNYLLVKIGALPTGGTDIDIPLTLTLLACGADKLNIYTGWSCDGYPDMTGLSSANQINEQCIKAFTLDLVYTELQITDRLEQENVGSADFCGTGETRVKYKYTLLTGNTDAKNISIKFYIPANTVTDVVYNGTTTGYAPGWHTRNFATLAEGTPLEIFFYLKPVCQFSGEKIEVQTDAEDVCGNPVSLQPWKSKLIFNVNNLPVPVNKDAYIELDCNQQNLFDLPHNLPYLIKNVNDRSKLTLTIQYATSYISSCNGCSPVLNSATCTATTGTYCDIAQSVQFDQVSTTGNPAYVPVTFTLRETHTVSCDGNTNCTLDYILDVQTCNIPLVNTTTQITCDNCISGFTPLPNTDYILSAWVKDNSLNKAGSITLRIVTKDNSGIPCADVQRISQPVGEIIDGWQKHELAIPLRSPDNTSTCTIDGIEIILAKPDATDANGEIFYDDIRVHPFDGMARSFVYDQTTGRLMAILDENNYATLYEYDAEGKLIRVKKETERGVQTIKEVINNTKKRQ